MRVIMEMCEYYGVSKFMMPTCQREHLANLKCHSKRESCPHYTPSIIYESEKQDEDNQRDTKQPE